MRELKRMLAVALAISVLIALFAPAPDVFAAGSAAVNFPEGCYTFASALDSAKCLDVAGAGIENGVNIQLWSANDSVAQMFFITKEKSNWYSIRNIDSRKAVDVAGGESRSGVNVQLYSWNGTAAQLWRFYDAGNGSYYIKNKLGFYLDVSGGQVVDGTNVQVYQANRTRSQMWALQPAQGIYTFTSGVKSSKCLDVKGAGTDDGTNMQIWAANGSAAQMFCITRVSAGWYRILNVNSQKAIDVAGGVSGSGTNVQLYGWNKTAAQLWQFCDAGNGYYYIKNKLGCYLDVDGGQSRDGTNVQVYQQNGTKAQMWKIEPADLTNSLFAPFLANLQMDGCLNFKNPLDKLEFYYKKFNHGAKYDVKKEGCWDNLFTDIAYPGFKGVFLFNGLMITPEQLGNILYGLTGNLLGFEDKTIYQGGGYAASGSRYLRDASKYYGDSAMDHEFISVGIKMAGATPSIALDLSEFPPWLLDLAKWIL